MKKYLLVGCLLIPLTICADSLCEQSVQRGVELFNQGKYSEAQQCFVYANERCPNVETAEWIMKCDEAINARAEVSLDSINALITREIVDAPFCFCANQYNQVYNVIVQSFPSGSIKYKTAMSQLSRVYLGKFIEQTNKAIERGKMKAETKKFINSECDRLIVFYPNNDELKTIKNRVK